MDQRAIIDVQVQAVDQEIANIHRTKVLLEVKVMDAETPTGDKEIDDEFKKACDAAKRTIIAQVRMLESRNAKLDELTKERDALTQG